MTPVTKPLVLAEQWKKKCFKFSTQSDDNLVRVISKVIDTLTVYLKEPAHPRLQPVLKALESERSIYLAEENSDVPSIRTIMYGIVQSVHGILLAKTSLYDSNSSETKTILAMIGEWKNKTSILSDQSDDILLPISTKLFDAVAVILKGAEQTRITTTLQSLEYELSVCKFSENADEPSIRTLMYGLIECIHGCLLEMTALKNSIPSEEYHRQEVSEQSLMVSSTSHNVPNILPSLSNPSINANSTLSITAELNEESMLFPINQVPSTTVKIEVKEDLLDTTFPFENQVPVFTQSPKKEPKEEIHDFMDFTVDEREVDEDDVLNGTMNTGIENDAPELRNELEESFMVEENAEDSHGIKKRTASNDYRSQSTVNQKARRSGTYLKCIECDFRTKVISTWSTHLRNRHSTTPTLAGLVLRCECGHECASYSHSTSCKISNFTVIRKIEGPIRRIEDAMTESDYSEDPSSNSGVFQEWKSARRVSQGVNYKESELDSDSDEEPTTKKLRSESSDNEQPVSPTLTNDPVSGVISFEVDTVFLLERENQFSRKLTLGGVPWRAKVEKAEDQDEVSICLYGPSAFCCIPDWRIDVRVDYAIVNADIAKSVQENQESSIDIYRDNDKKSVSVCTFDNITWTDLMDEQNGFISNNKIMFEIHLTILDVSGIRIAPQISSTDGNMLLNTVLIIGEEKVFVNKQILAEHSSFFKAMFFGEFEDRAEKREKLRKADKEDFLEMLSVINASGQEEVLMNSSSDDKITDGNVEMMLELADEFEINHVIDLAEAHLMSSAALKLSAKLLLSDDFSLFNLQDHCIAELKTEEKINNVKSTSDFKKLSRGLRKKLNQIAKDIENDNFTPYDD